MTDDRTDLDRLYEADTHELERLREDSDPDIRRAATDILAADRWLANALDDAGRRLGNRLERRRRRRGRAAATAAMLLAAGVAGLLFVRPGRPGRAPMPAPALDPGTRGLEVASPKRFAVFPTRDPNIAIVWFFEGD